jgi:hypothetical protein
MGIDEGTSSKENQISSKENQIYLGVVRSNTQPENFSKENRLFL